MYTSLKSWVNIPLQIIPCLSVDDVGDKSFGTAVNTLCYAEAKVNTVTDNSGRQVLSSTTLYVDSTVSVSSLDEVVFDGARQPVKSIGAVFDEHGVISLRTVYL